MLCKIKSCTLNCSFSQGDEDLLGEITHASKCLQYKVYHWCHLNGTVADYYCIMLLIVPSKWYSDEWLIFD